MGSPTAVRIVVFDLGGVLVRVARTWEEAHARAGLAAPPAIDDALRADLRRHTALHELGEIELEELARRVARASAGRYTTEDFLAMYAALCMEEMPGAAAVFDAIERAGLQTGILSNTNASHWARLVNEVGGPAEYPALLRARHRHASHLLGLRKPDRRIFHAFEERVGHRGADVLFFDDREENVVGAREAGWRAEAIDPDQPTTPQIFAALRAHGVE